MRTSLEKYYEGKTAERQRALALDLQKNVKGMTDRAYLQAVNEIEHVDMKGIGIPEQEVVTAICSEIVSMDISGRVRVRYDLARHEVEVSEVPAFIAAGMRSRKQAIRIPAASYSRGTFEAAIRNFDKNFQAS